MRQNNVDFQNRELPTNILALLLVTTRTADQPQEGMVVCGAETASAAEPRMIGLTRRHQEQPAIVPLNECDRLAATPKMAA